MRRIAVVGGGISGLSHAYFWKQKHPEDKIFLFSGAKIGGNIATEIFEGATLEPGPDSYLERNGLFTKMVADLGLSNELLAENNKNAKRYILKDGYLASAPKSPGGLITTSLLFFPEKFRIFFAMGKKFSLWPTITLFDAARNVLGISAAEYLASPFARGVYGSEAEDLEFSSLFPKLYAHIVNAPKLKQGLKAYNQERKEFWATQLPDVSFKRGIYSFKGGLITWVQAIEKSLRDSGVEIIQEKISRIDKSTALHTLASKTKSYGEFDRVVFTGSAADIGYVFRDFDKEFSRKIAEIKFSPINVVYNAWARKDFAQSGYGFLVPRKERAPILGTIFASNVFSGRIGDDKFLTKTMISGDSEVFKDAELASITEESIARIFKTRAKPLWSKVFRHAPGIPRYAPGYGEWKKEIVALIAKHEGVRLAGWMVSGIGLADQLETAYAHAIQE